MPSIRLLDGLCQAGKGYARFKPGGEGWPDLCCLQEKEGWEIARLIMLEPEARRSGRSNHLVLQKREGCSGVMDEVIQALNSLLEAERAAVEALVDLTRMSADIGERERLQQIGGEEAWACTSLREQIEALGGTPSRKIGPLLAQLRAREHLGARLHVFVQQQQAVLGHIRMLRHHQQVPEPVGELLAELDRIHVSTIAWCEQRAAAFGAREPSSTDSTGHPGEGRLANEGRETPHRGRNKRSAGYEGKRSEASRAESALPPPLSPEGSGPGPTF